MEFRKSLKKIKTIETIIYEKATTIWVVGQKSTISGAIQTLDTNILVQKRRKLKLSCQYLI